jgi:hypothetical protein
VTTQAKTLVDRIARLEAASKSGLLSGYGPAKAAPETGAKLPTSWGPAMRK